MLRIWIFFNKQTIYLEEATVQRKNQIAEQAGANLGRIHSWKNDIHNRVRTPGKCSPRIYLPFSKQSIGELHVVQPLSSDSSFHLVPRTRIRLWLSYELLSSSEN